MISWSKLKTTLIFSTFVLGHSSSHSNPSQTLSPPSSLASVDHAEMTFTPKVNVDSTSIYKPAYLDVVKYPIAPPDLQLEQVHVYVRHGERTPVGVRLADSPANIPRHWIMCKSAREFSAAVLSSSSASEATSYSEATVHARRFVERPDGTKSDGECLLGELTDVGRKSTLNYGKALRQLYIDRLKLIPDTLKSNEEVYFRSTNMPRTQESLNQIIHGLYPKSKCEKSTVPQVLVRNGQDENLFGNTYACKRLELLQIGFAQAAAAAYNPTLEPLDDKLSKYIGGNPIRVDGKPRASGILDTVRAAMAHGIKVPPEFEDKSINDPIERAVVNEWFADKTEEVRRLGMGRLLGDLSRKMQKKAVNGDKDPLKLLVHSTHDTALAAVCSTLDVFDERWPAFAASVTFELFKKLSSDKPPPSILQTIMSPLRSPARPEYYVRMRYQNRNLFLPICSEEGKHLPGSPEFCTISAFVDRVKALTPVDFEAECRAR